MKTKRIIPSINCGKNCLVIIFIMVFSILKSYSQEVKKYPEDHFDITLPADWKEIPKSEIEKLRKNAQKTAKTEKEINYTAGFQKRLSKKWFSLPYMLINVESSGRVSDSELKDIIKELDKVFKELLSSDKNNLKDIIKSLKTNEAYFDKKNSRIITSVDVKGFGSSISGLYLLNFTSYGAINLYFYANSSDWERQYPEFLEIADAIRIDSEFSYIKTKTVEKKDSIYDKTANNKSDNLNEINPKAKLSMINEVIYPFVNFLVFCISFLFLIYLISRSKLGYAIIVSISKYKLFFAIIVSIIFFVIQVKIFDFIAVPFILNIIQIYAIVRFLKYLEKNSEFKKQDVSQHLLNDNIKFNESLSENHDFNFKSFDPTINEIKLEKMNDSINVESNTKEDFKKEKNGLNENYECICSGCKKEIVINEQELLKKEFICPECNTINKVEEYNVTVPGTNILDSPEGISGWLIFPAIGIFTNLLSILNEIVQYIGLKEKVTQQYVIQYGIWSNVFLGVFLLIVASYFFGKRKQAPTIFIFYMFTFAVLDMVGFMIINSAINGTNSISEDGSIIRSFIVAGIWSWYFISSKRVKNTFVK